MSTISRYNFNNDAFYQAVDDASGHNGEDQSGLVSHWRLNDDEGALTIVDEQGINDATLVHDTFKRVLTGPFPPGWNGDGHGAHAEAAYNPGMLMDELAVSFWFNKWADYGQTETIFAKGTATAEDFTVRFMNNRISFKAASCWTLGQTFTYSNWHHYMCSYENGVTEQWLDNVYQGPNVGQSGPGSVTPSQDLYIAGLPSYPFQWSKWIGHLDNIMWFNCPLDATDRSYLWNGGSGNEYFQRLKARLARTFDLYFPLSGKNGDVVRVPHHADFTMTATKTFEVRCFFDVVDADHLYILTKGGNANNWQYCIRLNSSTQEIEFEVEDSLGQNVVAQSGVVPDPMFDYYIAASWDPTTKEARISVNGTHHQSAINGAINPSFIDTTDPMYMGGLFPPVYVANKCMSGGLHEVRISDVVLAPNLVFDAHFGTSVVE